MDPWAAYLLQKYFLKIQENPTSFPGNTIFANLRVQHFQNVGTYAYRTFRMIGFWKIESLELFRFKRLECSNLENFIILDF